MASPVTPKKRLGQHFLMDLNIACKIVNSLDASLCEEIIEVGPGTGVLTQYLKELAPILRLSEVDEESIAYLASQFGFQPSDHIGDFLRVNEKVLGHVQTSIIGNFPYNISSQIFFKLLDYRDNVPQCVGMIQKEVADRICSPHGNKVYGILSVLLQAYYHVEYLFTVEPTVFNPPPKVRSAVIRLTRKDRESASELDGVDFAFFKKIVKMAFSVRRKTLRNALKPLNLPEDVRVRDVFSKRAEQLSISDFINLVKELDSAGRSNK